MNFTQLSIVFHVVDCPAPVSEQPTHCPHVVGPWHAESLDATWEHPCQSSAFVASFSEGPFKPRSDAVTSL